MLQTARHLKTELQTGTRQIKGSTAEKTNERWWGKRNGQVPCNLDEKLVDNEQSYWWLKSGDIKGETERTIVAAQGHEISTNYFKNKTLKEETDSKCQLCKQHEETIDWLVKNECVIRHDKVCANLHYSICKALGIETTDKWHTHIKVSVWTGRC